nr:cell division protein SepF [uncultured Methanobrevibacter sp.]
MSFKDDIKRSLGFEETESNEQKKGVQDVFNSIKSIITPKDNYSGQRGSSQQQYRPNQQPQYRANPQPQYRQAPRPEQGPTRPAPRPTPVYDEFEVIEPEQSYYEIVLIRPKTIDDINYIVDQVIEERNPVIVDLSFLEKESVPNFRLAGDKIKQMRSRYGAQALLLSRSEEKNLIIITPKKVQVINKG